MKNCSLGRLGKGAIKFCINYIHYRNLHRIKIPLEVGRFSSFFILSKLSAWLRLGLISIFIRIGWSNIEGSRSHMGRWTSKKLRYYPHISSGIRIPTEEQFLLHWNVMILWWILCYKLLIISCESFGSCGNGW